MCPSITHVTVLAAQRGIFGQRDYGRSVVLSDTRALVSGRGQDATTVRHLVEAIGSPVLHVLAAPRGVEQRVRCTVLHDPIDDLADEPDAVLLMAGTRADDPAAIEIVRAAAARGYCAIVLKRRGADITALVTEASVLGVMVLSAADEVSWRHLDALLQSVLGSQGIAADSASGAGDELFALANAIAGVIGGSVAFEDMDRRVIAYSSIADQRIDSLREQGILDRQVPDMDRNRAQYHDVLAADGVVQFPAKTDELPRSAIAIKAGQQPLGSIWAIESERGLTSDGARALTEGARLAALTMLRSLNASGLELQLREAALLRALDGSLAGDEAAFRLSLPGGAELSLVGFACTAAADGSTPMITHVASALSRHIAAYRPDAAMATTSRTVYVLVPGGGAGAAMRFATGAMDATRGAFPGLMRAAVARTSADPAELPALRREVDDVLRVTVAQPDLPTVAQLADVHMRVLLAHVGDLLEHEPQLRHAGVEAMLAHDRERGTEYSASVRAWLAAVGDVADAAHELDVHPNTLRYRLRRAAELFDIALDRPDERLATWLHLRVAR